MQISDIKRLMEEYNIAPKKSLGQNFLINEHVLEKIISSSNLQPDDTVIEVGPGLGVLTKQLAPQVKKLITIELDKGVIPLLQKELKQFSNVEILQQDALTYTPPSIPYKLIANIPYYITSPLISHFLEAENQPSHMVLLMQKEVAEKICAPEGKLNVLAIHVQIFGTPKIITKVSPGSFYPPPKVDSALLSIETHAAPLITKNRELFFKVVHSGFRHKRKTLYNALIRSPYFDSDQVKKALNKAEIDPGIRAQKLTIKDWERLTNALA